MIKHFVVETHKKTFKRRVFYFERPDIHHVDYKIHAGVVDKFFHRPNKTGIAYNKTDMRIFELYREGEEHLVKMDFSKVEIIECKNIFMFFDDIGFDYESLSYKTSEITMKYESRKLKLEKKPKKKTRGRNKPIAKHIPKRKPKIKSKSKSKPTINDKTKHIGSESRQRNSNSRPNMDE